MYRMDLIDTHCHLDLEHHFPDFEQILHEAGKCGISAMVLAGVRRSGWERMLGLCGQYSTLHAAPGLHPMYLESHGDDDLMELKRIACGAEVVAVGEIGLDYQVPEISREAQQQLFESQLDIASEFALPVLLHVRKAHDQVLATLRRRKFTRGGVVHAFNGSMQQAEQYIGLGFMISVCGTITFERSRKIRRVAAELPLDALVLESDSPDIPPAKHYGQRNLPVYLPEILSALAEVRGEKIIDVARATSINARKILKLGERQSDV